MAQVKLDIRFEKKTMGAFHHSLYLDVNRESWIDGEDVNQTYGFDNDIKKLSIVKTPYYPKVLIITPRFRLRFTNWDSIDEAKEKLEDGDLLCHQIIVDEETYYVVAQIDEDISDLQIPIAEISQEPFDTPFLDQEEIRPKFRPLKAFVTNATARSVALIAYIYDQYENGQVHKLSNDDIEEYEELFASESPTFARSYNAAFSDFSIIENIISNLAKDKKKELFYEETTDEVLNKLKRRVFHTKEECLYMMQDFVKNNGHRLENSGVFDVDAQERHYFLHVDYLYKLGFRGCRRCNTGPNKMEFFWGEKEDQLLLDLYQQMLAHTSLIAKVFRCEEDTIIERLDFLRAYNYNMNMSKNPRDETICDEIEIDLDDDEPDERTHRHYGQFIGSYAQDVAGYDDDTINDAFEGDPDNYWNID